MCTGMVLTEGFVSETVASELACSDPKDLLRMKESRLTFLTRNGQEPSGATLLRAEIREIKEKLGKTS